MMVATAPFRRLREGAVKPIKEVLKAAHIGRGEAGGPTKLNGHDGNNKGQEAVERVTDASVDDFHEEQQPALYPPGLYSLRSSSSSSSYYYYYYYYYYHYYYTTVGFVPSVNFSLPMCLCFRAVVLD